MRLSAETRFWNKVDKTPTCWLWTGTTKDNGYGVFAEDGLKARKRVHRFSWELHFGAIPEGLMVCHNCDVRNCVRPDHLFLGTAKDNHDDMATKGRRRTRGNPAVCPPEPEIEASVPTIRAHDIRRRTYVHP